MGLISRVSSRTYRNAHSMEQLRHAFASPKRSPTSTSSLPLILIFLQLLSLYTKAAPIGKRPEDDGNKGFVEAFIASISVILVSEIGDKTFFIAAIMSAQYNRLTVFSGAISALAIMTAMSAAMGSIATALIKVEYTRFISNILFVLFGLRSLREGITMSATESEFHETDAELKEAEEKEEKANLLGPEASLVSKPRTSPVENCLRMFLSRVFLSAFTMTFLAEWGDRSQITTVILATHDNPYGVTAGGCIGHFICTGFAVLGGRMIAQKISVKHITIMGGFVFIAFAVHGFFTMDG